jgi:hypothetical protein
MAGPAYPPTILGSPFPQGAAVTGTQQVAGGGPASVYGLAQGYDQAANVDGTGGYSVGPTTGSSMLGPAIQVIWSKEILFQAMPVLRFEQFAVKKTELGTMPGLTVNFMRYNNLPIPAGPLVEGVRMKTYAMSAKQYQITSRGAGLRHLRSPSFCSTPRSMTSWPRPPGCSAATWRCTWTRRLARRSSGPRPRSTATRSRPSSTRLRHLRSRAPRRPPLPR